MCKFSATNVSILRYVSTYNPLLFQYLSQDLKIKQNVVSNTKIWNIFWFIVIKQANLTAHYIAPNANKLGLKYLIIMKRFNTVTIILYESS